MDKIGLNLPAGRRKAANVTLLTSLVEGKSGAINHVPTPVAPAISGACKVGFFPPFSLSLSLFLSLCWKSAYALIRVMWTDFASQVIKHEGCVCVERERARERGGGGGAVERERERERLVLVILVTLQRWPSLSGARAQVHAWHSFSTG